MSERSGFSFASVLLSYLMIAGGISAALLGLSLLELDGTAAEIAFYAAFGVGAFVGGFFAARASAGSTVAEPAIGGVLLVGTIGGLIAATPVGPMIWHLAQDQLIKTAAILGGATLVGALVGAWISERVFGESTTSSIPWILYVAIAVIGGCFLAFLAAVAVRLGGAEPTTVGDLAENDRTLHVTILLGIGVGCLVAGLASGASARTRILIAALVGAAGGVFGFFVLATALQGSSLDKESLLGAAVIAAGGGLLGLLASAVGWAAAGRPRA